MKSKKKFLKLSLVSAGLLHGINKWIDSTAISKLSSTNTGKYYHWKHGDIYYRKIGTGKPLLLLHDLSPFFSSYEWMDIADSLKDEYCVYVPDLPGCGRSDKPGITFTNYYFVQMITSFVHDVIGEKTYVAATGLTGSAVLMANLADTELFHSVMLVNPLGLNQLKQQPNRRSKMIQTLFDLPVIGTTLYYTLTNRMNIEHYLTENCFFNPFFVNPRLLKHSYDASHEGNGFGKYLLGSVQSNYVNVDISNALAHTKKEIHIMFGEQVTRYHDTIMEYRNLNNNITAEIIPECKMYPHIEAFEDVLESMYLYLN